MNTETAPGALTLSFAATPDDFLTWSTRVGESRASLQAVASAPNEVRRYRPIKVAEIWRFARITRRQWDTWNVAQRPAGDPSSVPHPITVEQMHEMMDEMGIRPARPASKAPLRLLVSNFKGGAQKTTLSLQLVHYLGLRGYRVLVIDTDPQGTLTQHMGFTPSLVKDENTLSVVYERHDDDLLEQAVPELRPVPTHIDGVDLLPANLNMTAMDFNIASLFVQDSELGRRYPERMDRALRAIEDRYDLVLIDSPPAFSFLAICMGWIADSIIVPMPTQVPDFAGTGDFCEMLASYTKTVENWYGQTKRWAPVVFVHARVTGGTGSVWVDAKAGDAFRHFRLNQVIPESRPVSNCLTVFKSVFEATSEDTDAKGLAKAREAYLALCERIEELLAEGWSLKPEIVHEP